MLAPGIIKSDQGDNYTEQPCVKGHDCHGTSHRNMAILRMCAVGSRPRGRVSGKHMIIMQLFRARSFGRPHGKTLRLRRPSSQRGHEVVIMGRHRLMLSASLAQDHPSIPLHSTCDCEQKVCRTSNAQIVPRGQTSTMQLLNDVGGTEASTIAAGWRAGWGLAQSG